MLKLFLALLLPCLATATQTLSAAEQLALSKLCASIPNWCPAGYANAGYDYCSQLGPYVTCSSNTVSSIVLQNVPGVSSLSGTIPTEIGLLSNLKQFYSTNQAIGGFIPTQLGRTALYDINLSGNLLIGPIPSELGVLPLVGLELATNNLNGQIPSTIFKPTLQNLNLKYNSLSGSIPSEVGNSPSLAFLQLNNNMLTGSIPRTIGKPKGLFQLTLSSNSLSGTIPTQIGNLTALGAFTIVNNRITGPIPTEIGNMNPGRGSYFLLGENSLSGTIPTEVGRLTALSMFGVYSAKKITGKIPTEVGLMTTLQTLWLFGTSIYDSIPSSVNQLTNIISLQLQDNLLSGTIPSLQTAFGSSRNIQYQEIYLHDNYFTGSLPNYFGNQVVMQCDDTFLNPVEICRFPRMCNNTVQERASTPDYTQVCKPSTGSLLQGTLKFTPASNEDCFAEYLVYLGSSSQVALSSTPILRIPKTPRNADGSVSGVVTDVDVTGAAYFMVYSYSGVPTNPSSIPYTPSLFALNSITACDSATRTMTPTRSPSPSVTPSTGTNTQTDAGKNDSGSSDNATIGVAVAVVLVGAAALIIVFVIFQRRRRTMRAIVSPAAKGYDNEAL